MSENRTSLGFDDDIDISELTKVKVKPRPTPDMAKALSEASADLGFVSRESKAKKVKKRSPYVVQKNIKMRIGMSELLNEVTLSVGSGSDQETLEKALLSIIEEKNLVNLKKKYLELLGDQ
jgi:hypothetical protein